MPGRLLSVGNAVVDVVAAVPALPERGGDVLAHAGAVEVGGSGFNALVAAARQGLPAAYAGAHGTGPFGELVRAALRSEGVEVLLPPVADADTGFDIVVVDDGGERTFLTVAGAEARLSREALDGVPVLARDAVHVSGYGLVHPVSGPAIASWLARVPPESTVLFDPGPLVGDIPPAALDRVTARADWWSSNLREALIASGEADGRAAAVWLAGRRARRGAIVRTGPEGCIVAQRDAAPVAVPGFVVAAVDTNGAGDAHTGVFLAALARGCDPVAAARRANAAAAIAVTRRGPGTAPTGQELDAFLER